MHTQKNMNGMSTCRSGSAIQKNDKEHLEWKEEEMNTVSEEPHQSASAFDWVRRKWNRKRNKEEERDNK